MYIVSFTYLFTEYLLSTSSVSSAILTLGIHQSVAQNPCPHGVYILLRKNTIKKQVKSIQVVMSVRSNTGQSDFMVSLHGVADNLDGQRKPR